MKMWIPDFVKKDFLRKFVSVIFALIVWLSVSTKLGKEGKISDVKVYFSLPDNMILLDENDYRVTLTVSTSERRISLLMPSDFKISYRINANRYVPGELYKVYITPHNVKSPFGVKVLSVSPNTFYINIDRNSSKHVPVKPRITGKLSEGYKVTKVLLNPDAVKITGPESIISGIELLRTAPILLDQYAIESFECPVIVNAKKYKGVKVVPSTVNARIEIKKDTVTRLYPNVPIRILQPLEEKNLSFTPLSTPHVDIELSGSRKDMETVVKQQIKPFIDLGPLDKPGAYHVNVNCWSPVPGIIVKRIIPASIEVKIIQKNR